MKIDAIDWFKFNYLTRLYLIIISTRMILIVDTAKPTIATPYRQMCSKIQSMLSSGKYQTYQMSSNITYIPRIYAQTFLAYSPLDDILIFIEPKHQLHVYNPHTVRLIVNLTTTNIVYATSCTSLTSDDRHDLFFVYETRLDKNFTTIRICQIHFDRLKLNFQDIKCIETLNIRYEILDIRINGFTIKYNHAETNKSLLFISTNIGLIYVIFDTYTGLVFREPIILNDTLNEGSIVTTSSGIIYYANKQEHTIHEIHVTRDFRIRYGKIIKSNAIKSPFGLITDECNHLYISTKSMILVMFIQTYKTIRSVFTKASDLPITIERLNATTYVYPTVQKYSGRLTSIWMFNFLSFSDPEKTTITTRSPIINTKKNTESNGKQIETTHILKLSTISESISLMTTMMTTITQTYTHFSSTSTTFEHTSTVQTTLTQQLLTESTSYTEPINYSTDPTSTLFSESVPSISNSLETLETNVQNVTSTTLSTTLAVILNDTYTNIETISDYYTTSLDTTSTSEEEEMTLSSSLSTEVSTEYLHSTIATSTSLETTLLINSSEITLSSEKLSTDVESTSLDTTLTTTSEYIQGTSSSHFSTSIDQSTSSIVSDVIISTTPFESSSLQNQFYSSTSESSDNLSNESPMTTELPTTLIQTSTLSVIVTDFLDKEMTDEINQKYSSPMLVEVEISSTLYPSSLFDLSSTIIIPSLHPLPTYPSTTITQSNQLLPSEYFSVATTTTMNPFDILSSSVSTLQTTDFAITSDITDQNWMNTFSDESSFPSFTTTYPEHTSSESSDTDYATLSTAIVTTTSLDSTPLPFETTLVPLTTLSTGIVTTTSLDSTPLPFETTLMPLNTLSTDIVTTTSLDSTPLPFETTLVPLNTLSTDIATTTSLDSTPLPFETTLVPLTTLSTGIVTTTSLDSTPLPFETTLMPLTTTAYWNKYISTPSSLEITSTISRDIYNPTTVPFIKRPNRRTSASITSSNTKSTTTTANRRRTRRRNTTRFRSTSSTDTTTITVVQTTSSYNEFITSSPIFIQDFKSKSFQKQMAVYKPLFNANSSNTLLSNELLNILFNDTSNFSTEKFIFLNLIDLPPSSWNISLTTNESILLDIALPSPSFPSTFDTTTNLTFMNVEANRFSTNIFGLPINLQVDQIQAKQFSLAMNLTNNQSNQSLSDVVIGHIKSETFELNITKSDNMNIHVQQVDSETAELFFDSKFCTNESNLQINLNLSKNGSIRYGNRAPLRIGPVFTRVHMLKHSCDLEQPFTLFFDICQGQNPCLNGGTCKTQIPNYDDPLFSQQQTSQINYQCICPVHISGEHCEHSQYPLGYCLNGGSLIPILDTLNNQSIQQCLCAQGYQGHHCEDNINNCINIDCSHHGICQDGINTYKCSCFEGFYGDLCEEKTVETVLLQVASKSFATVAILLIAGIASLVVASDIHTYLTRKKQKSPYRLSKIPRATSELFENSVLLLGFGDAPIEMSDLSIIERETKTTTTTTVLKQRQRNIRKKARYKRIAERRYTRTLERPLSKRSLFSNPAYETLL